MTPAGVTNWLADRIAAHRPMPVDAFMRAALTDPEHGYYRRSQAIGASGDFITAPEISQIFGELIGIWVAASWQALGEPTAWRLIELGPGRGTLMADLLRALQVLPAARAALTVQLVEVNERLRDEQRAKLAGCGVPVGWRDSVDPPLAPLPTVVIANEFLDALPIRQLVARDGRWHERMVTTAAHLGLPPSLPLPHQGGGGGLALVKQAWHLAPLDPSPLEGRGRVGGCLETEVSATTLAFTASETPIPPEQLHRLAEPEVPGSICELMSGAADYLRGLAAALADAPQIHLYIDYGHLGPVQGDTLQAVTSHRYVDLLQAPGAHDLSAQVDFAQIGAAAISAGLACFGAITQAEFLGRLGAAARLERLAAGKEARTIHQLQTGLARLMDPSGMGARFKVLALASPGLAVPPVF